MEILKIKLHRKRMKKEIRNRQGSNLRGQSPLDFKSNALTTRPRLLLNIWQRIIFKYLLFCKLNEG